ncbi:RNase adapter RapZ [Anaerorhabdus sp.]|jgi:RNase adapter protein RapZ|uniref:RNase adapter RapZ n=1 Tax=Anaerorhabdus sp. TaxID=1872524 RepID=UPI002B1ECD99|nr:RNase adapter RapZ [Anaerorhabdus sp.]MEA4875878.1 RNase adapter RapZ [Anaerorhabdus sp.]
MNKKRVILVSGMSGAGKTSATNILEDMGYHCIDQFPVQILNDLVDVIETTTDPRFDYTALSTSAKDLHEFLRAFKGTEMDVRVLFLDASDDVLLHRYKSTRRTHPLLISNAVNTLEEAISVERNMFTSSKEGGFVTIDTTFLDFKGLKSKIESYFKIGVAPSFSISFVSFGYKNGVPMDADIMLDVRFLPNPFWVPELRAYSGDDEAVYKYVMDNDQTQEFVKRLTSFLDYAFSEYVKEGKNHFTVAIGCTGGQHRSVAITNYLFDFYRKKYNCYKDHRDKKDYANG